MKLFSDFQHICNCSTCGARLHWRWGQNVYDGGPWYCGRCGSDVTVDMYGKGVHGYYVVSMTGVPVFYKYIRDARMISDMFGAQLYYAHKFHSKRELVTDT